MKLNITIHYESIYFLSAEFNKTIVILFTTQKVNTCCNHPFIIWQNISSIINHKTYQSIFPYVMLLLFILMRYPQFLNILLYPEPDIKSSKKYQDKNPIVYQINNASLNV